MIIVIMIICTIDIIGGTQCSVYDTMRHWKNKYVHCISNEGAGVWKEDIIRKD